LYLLKRDSVSFDSGEFDDIRYPANGSTYTMLAEQVPDAPGFSFPIAIVEGCDNDNDGEFSTGFSQQFPLNDASPFLDNDCPVAISSYDPNDKQGFPIGYSEEHFIEPETAIEFLDFNDPIITNETFHTLGEIFTEIIVGTIEHPTRSDISIVVRPNPFNGKTEIEIQNHSADSYFLEVFDLSGRLVRQERYAAAPIVLYKRDLIPGLYFYRLSANDGFLNTGKIIIQK